MTFCVSTSSSWRESTGCTPSCGKDHNSEIGDAPSDGSKSGLIPLEIANDQSTKITLFHKTMTMFAIGKILLYSESLDVFVSKGRAL